jgi:hypothetical protein
MVRLAVRQFLECDNLLFGRERTPVVERDFGLIDDVVALAHRAIHAVLKSSPALYFFGHSSTSVNLSEE